MRNEWQLPALGSKEIGKCSYKCDSYDIIPACILHYPNLLEWRRSQLFCYMGFNLFPYCSLLPYRNFITWCLFYPPLLIGLACAKTMTNGMGNIPKCSQPLCAAGRGCNAANSTSLGCSGWEFRWWHLALGRRVSSAAHLPECSSLQPYNDAPIFQNGTFCYWGETHEFYRKFS